MIKWLKLELCERYPYLTICSSVRIPAAFNGLYGLRGSYGRVPYAGCVNSLEGQDSIPSVLGPLTNSIGAIKAFLKGVLSQKPWLQDPLVVRKPWNEEEYKLTDHGNGSQLCFAVMWDDGHTVPHPPVRRGLEVTKQALLAAGHRVIDWTPLAHAEAFQVAGAIFGAGALEDFRVTTAPSGEPIITTMDLSVDTPGMAPLPPDAEPFFNPPPSGLSAYELWQAQRRKRDYRQAYLDHWNATVKVTGTGRPVDAIISPCAAFTARPHGSSKCVCYMQPSNSRLGFLILNAHPQESGIHSSLECTRLRSACHSDWLVHRPRFRRTEACA